MKIMLKKYFCASCAFFGTLEYLFALCVPLALLSCEKSLDETDPEVTGQSPISSACLHIITRSGDEALTDNTIKQGRIYIFDSDDQCVDLLTTDESSNSATTELPAGTYSLYAVGSEDLTRFTLPTKEAATPTSVITCAEGKVMDDLLLKSATVTLADNENLNQTITLDHMVFSLKTVEVSSVPNNVTAVTLSIAPLYQSLQLNGTYVNNPTGSYQVSLTKAETGNTWSATPNQMLFPSKGTPTIKVSFTTSEGTQSYSYTASEELVANHHFTIKGTYVAAQGVALTGILTASDWGEDRTVTFNFDETVNLIPVAGQKYNDYYVISVDETHHTALLLAQHKVTYTAPAETGSSEEQDLWLSAFNTAMADLTKPSGAQGNWRLPSLAEATLFTSDASLYPTSDKSSIYFCLNGTVLNWIQTTGLPSNPVTKTGATINNTVYLRPVITISY